MATFKLKGELCNFFTIMSLFETTQKHNVYILQEMKDKAFFHKKLK